MNLVYPFNFITLVFLQEFLKEYDQFTLATTYFDLKEYDRAGYFLENCTSPKSYFLYMYSRYLADEKRKLDKASDSIGKEL